jgi:signal transduction histidine kinase
MSGPEVGTKAIEPVDMDPAAVLSRLAAEIRQTQDAHLAIRIVLRQGSQLLGAACAAAFVLDERGIAHSPVFHAIPQEQFDTLSAALQPVVCSPQTVLIGEAAFWPDVAKADEPLCALIDLGLAACLVQPLLRGASCLGALCFLWDHPQGEDPARLEWASVLGGYAVLALDNARLFEAALRQAVELGTFYETATATAEGKEVQPLLEAILDQAARLLDAQGGAILLTGERAPVLRTVAVRALPPETIGREVAFGQGLAGSVAVSLQPLAVDAYEQGVDPVAHASDAEGMRVLVLPLIWHQTLLGVIEIWADGSHRPFIDTDLRLARLVVHQAASALGVARLVEAEREQRRRAEALQEASLAINRAVGLDEVLERLLEQVVRAFDCDAANFQTIEGGRTRVLRSYGYEQFGVTPEAMAGVSLSVEQYPNVQRVAAGETVLLEDTSIDPSWVLLPGFEWIRSWAGVPIRFGEEILGILNLDSSRSAAFDGTAVSSLKAYAAHAAVAMHNARLYQKLADEHVKLLQVYEIGQHVTASLDPNEILINMINGVLHAVGGTLGGAFEINLAPEDTMEVRSVVYCGSGDHLREAQPQPELIAEQVARSQAPQQNVVSYTFGNFWVSGMPLFIGDRMWGVVLIWAPWQVEGTPTPLGILAAAGQQTGLALLNAEQHARVQRRLAEMTLVQGVANAIARRLDTGAVIQTVTEQLHSSLGYPAVQVYLREGDDLVLRTVSGPQPVLGRLSVKRGITGRVLRTGEPACVRDVRQDPDYVAGLVGTRAEMTAPIRVGDEIIGVVNVESSDPTQVHPENLELLVILADHVSVALQNAGLYEQVQKNVELLEERVRVRTAQLEGALAQAKAAERSKAQFVADISHELRTPLTNIGLYLDLLEIGREDRRSEYMSILRHETERLSVLIQQLLAMSEYDVGEVRLRMEPVDINALINVLVGDRARLIESKGLGLKLQLAKGLPKVAADGQQMMQVMTNLLTNAMNYTPPRGTITILSERRTAQSRSWVTFAIADTGPGIPEDEKPRMFDRFFRGIVGRASGHPGTGLGLAICKEIVDRHAGRIAVSSEGGLGTKVTVWLPENEERAS